MWAANERQSIDSKMEAKLKVREIEIGCEKLRERKKWAKKGENLYVKARKVLSLGAEEK